MFPDTQSSQPRAITSVLDKVLGKWDLTLRLPAMAAQSQCCHTREEQNYTALKTEIQTNAKLPGTVNWQSTLTNGLAPFQSMTVKLLYLAQTNFVSVTLPQSQSKVYTTKSKRAGATCKKGNTSFKLKHKIKNRNKETSPHIHHKTVVPRTKYSDLHPDSILFFIFFFLNRPAP